MALRGIFPEFEGSTWSEVASSFLPNQVPRFKTKEEALKFTEDHIEKDIPSNPDEPNLRHSISTLTDWNQIEKYLLPKIYHYRNGESGTSTLPDQDSLDSNSFMMESESFDEKQNPVRTYLESRLNLRVHTLMTDLSVMNTFKYCFYSMRCGIYVHIKNNKLVIFCPFVNKEYTNNWQGKLKFSGSGATIQDYYRLKNSGENFIPDMSKWWANGNIICSQHCTEEEEKTVGGSVEGGAVVSRSRDVGTEVK